MPNNFCMMIIEAPDDFEELDATTLPNDWQEYPEKQILKQTGNDFLKQARNLLLKVPSALVNEEYNYLMNPLHTKAGLVKIVSKKSFSFDERLLV